MSEKQDVAPVLLRGSQANRALLALGQRERGTLGALLASGKIGTAELFAANRWYETFAMAEYGVFDAEKAGTGGNVRLFAQERQAAAATSYRLAREAIGMAGDLRMRAILSDGQSMAALALRLQQDRKMVAGMVVADLVRLAEHYTEVDHSRGRGIG